MTDTQPEPALAPAPLTLARVAELVGGRPEGPPDTAVEGVGPVDEAGPAQMGFLALKRYVRFLEGCRAGSVLVSAGLERYLPEGTPRVVVDEPYAALLTLLSHFHPEERPAPHVHPTAVLGRGVRLGDGVRVEPYAVIGDRVTRGSRHLHRRTLRARLRRVRGCAQHAPPARGGV